MEVLFFAIAIIGGIIALPIVALVGSSRAHARAKRAEQEANLVRRELTLLRTEVEKARAHAQVVDGRLSAWVAHFQSDDRAQSPAPAAHPTSVSAAPAPLPSAGAPAPEPSPNAPATDLPQPPPDAPAPVATHSRYRETRARHAEPSAPESTLADPQPSAPFDWERLVGVRLFAWLGGGALFLAAALFLHYSIQQNLIAPPVRVAIGLAVGAVALLGGDRLRSKARFAAEAITGAGVAILYAALFAARVLYELIPNPVAFAGMILVTVTSGVVAVRRNSFFVALLSLLGGMATPYLLSSGQDRPLVLFAYVALLSGGVVAVARMRNWPLLALLGLVCSTILFAGWANKYLVPDRAPYALGAVAIVAALFAFVRIEGTAAKNEEGEAVSNSSLERLLVGAASLLPFATALFFAGDTHLDVDPRVLSPYLLVVSAVAVLSDRRGGSHYLSGAAAALSSAALTARVGPDLFPERAALALGSFALVPLGFLVAWIARRGKPEEPGLRAAAAISLLGALPVVFGAAGRDVEHEAFRVTLAYAWLHAAGLVAVGSLRREGWPLSAAQALAFCSLTVLTRGNASGWQELVVATGVSGVLFWGLPLVHPNVRADRIAWWAAAAALPLHFLLVYDLAHQHWDGGPLGALAVACAMLAAVSFRASREHTRSDPKLRLGLSALYGAITLAFVTTSVPLLVENEWLTISWAAEVAALAWLRRRVPHGGLILALAVLAAGVSVRLLLNPALWEYHERTEIPIFNYYLYTFGLSAVAFLAAQRLLRTDELARRFRLPALLGGAAALLLFVLMNVEIADYYSTGPSVKFRLSGGGLAEDMTYSLAWGCFSIALLVVGMVWRNRPSRIGALVVLVLTVGKVFLHDLWELGSLYRVGSIVGLAVALLGVSFLTQRFVLPKEKA